MLGTLVSGFGLVVCRCTRHTFVNIAPYAMEKPVARSHALAAHRPGKCSGWTHRPSTPRAIAAPKQTQQPQSITVLHAGCDHWITLQKKYYFNNLSVHNYVLSQCVGDLDKPHAYLYISWVEIDLATITTKAGCCVH